MYYLKLQNVIQNFVAKIGWKYVLSFIKTIMPEVIFQHDFLKCIISNIIYDKTIKKKQYHGPALL